MKIALFFYIVCVLLTCVLLAGCTVQNTGASGISVGQQTAVPIAAEPPVSEDKLIADLQSKEAFVREAAIKGLRNFKDAEAIDALVDEISAEYIDSLKCEAVSSLGDIGDQSAAGPIIKLFIEHGSCYLYAIEALGKIGGGEATAALIEQFKKDDGQNEIIEALVEDGEDAVKPLIALIQDMRIDYTIRRDAIGILAKIGDQRAVVPLGEALNNKDIRGDAAFALAQIGGDTAVGYLAACLKRGDYGVTDALAQIGGPKAEAALINALGNGESAYVLQNSALALGKFNDKASITALITALTKHDKHPYASPELAEDICASLKLIGADAEEPLLEKLSELMEKNHENSFSVFYTLRVYVINALGAIGDTRAIAPLSFILSDKKDSCRADAAIALGKIGDASAVAPLAAVMQDKDEIKSIKKSGYLWRCAVDALNKIDSVEAVSALLSVLDSDNSNARYFIASVIDTGDGRYAKRLDKAMEYKDLAIIAGACGYYIHLGKTGSEQTLIDSLNKCGTKNTAIAFLNCGNKTLYTAGEKWAEDNGYRITYSPNGNYAQWGK